MIGFTNQLQTPTDLLDKLKYDLGRMQDDPSNIYASFDFFVTAEHLPDWIGDKTIKKEYEILKVVSHLANGAKHFMVSSQRHNILERNTYWCDSNEQEVKYTDGEGGSQSHSALELAEKVYKFWENILIR
ncbi:hypothetical protein [Pseudoalteromonas sp. DY56-GL79]|uniref:hypothetical protein n=1 Tax=Pseudoalteromonas sp. DY56-GL79 TaxID=2967131 RepID=UPI00352B0D85